MKKNQNIFYILLLLSFLIPFIFQKSIFPFYRFGMFAEPPVNTKYKETFEVLVYHKNNKKYKNYDPRDVGLYPSIFKYLLRNYYYRNESDQLLKIIADKNTQTDLTYFFIKKNAVKIESIDLKEHEIIVDTISFFTAKKTSVK